MSHWFYATLGLTSAHKVCGLLGSCCAVLWMCGCDASSSKDRPVVTTFDPARLMAIKTPADEALLKKLCQQCHLFAEPGTLAKDDWEKTVSQMVPMTGYGRIVAPQRLDTTAIMHWFRERAPDSLPLADRAALPEQPPPLRHVTLRSPKPDEAPFVSQIKLLTSPSGERRLLTCDMRHGWLCEITSLAGDPKMQIVCDQVPYSCRLEPIDLNGDGDLEFLVANLGSFVAMDHNLGSVDWLSPKHPQWDRVVLCDNLGRVADVKSFDFDADGDLDIAVAEFGWRMTGRVLLLENTTRRSGKSTLPSFKQRTLDERHGAVQVEIADLDSNQRPDVIALLAQEHESLFVYLNQPDGSFLPRELFRAPHPVWGYSGFQLIDLDGDGDLDVLLTNGDMMDGPTLKPYHSIAWLENVGDLKFEPHTLAELPGVHRAEAADLDGDGDLDIVACTLVPEGTAQQAVKQRSSLPPALVWLEQTAPGQFEFHLWERGPGRYPTLTTGDFDGDGKPDVALGIGLWEKSHPNESQFGDVELWLSGKGNPENGNR
ncbi:hypothetical protein LBMAG52_33260 [Planctomycetia bacterium]|nr:hypothetical protein LBMAG52_33260 [Planctomycetia bacterium]